MSCKLNKRATANKTEESFYKPILEIFQLLTTYGDVFEYYANSYVSDFEFLFGNYIDTINSSIISKSSKYLTRHNKITKVISYRNSKYKKLFDSMDSSLRNALTHRAFFVDSEKNSIILENYERDLEEISLVDLEDKTFKLKIISYMLIVSEEYLSMSNNTAIKHIKSIAKEFICNPINFMEIWEEIMKEICSKLDEDPKNMIYSLILRNFSNFVFNRIILIMLESLNIFGLIGFEFLLAFSAHLYKLMNIKLDKEEENRYIQQLKQSYISIDIPENKALEKEIKKFIMILILKFVNLNSKVKESLRNLYDTLSIL